MEKLLNNLKNRGFIPTFVKSRDEIFDIFKAEIPCGSEIGFGGSMTVEALELPQKLHSAGYICNHQTTSSVSWQDLCIYNKNSKYYISSTNAITKDGILVNMDGRANRIAEMCYGPEKLFIVCGTNKICPDLTSAIDRVENVASPLNAKRLNRKTPCVVTGKCSKCNSPETICKALLINYHPTTSIKTYVIIIDEKLGF